VRDDALPDAVRQDAAEDAEEPAAAARREPLRGERVEQSPHVGNRQAGSGTLTEQRQDM
jgi:hypothetical protein